MPDSDAVRSGEAGREQSVEAILRVVPEEAIVVYANGYLARCGYRVRGARSDFYMLGSMGLAASVGLGVALTHPDRSVVVIDGDGNLLMGLGILPVIGAAAPRLLSHVVIDNAAYASTGGQPTVAPYVDFAAVARASGYRDATRATDPECGAGRVRAALAAREGPFLLHQLVSSAPQPPSPRVGAEPGEIAAGVRAALGRPTRPRGHRAVA